MRENRASHLVGWKTHPTTGYIAPNSRPPAHRSFNHGQGVLRPYSLGHGVCGSMSVVFRSNYVARISFDGQGDGRDASPSGLVSSRRFE